MIQTKERPGFSETEPFFHGIETLLRLDAVHRIFISDMPGSPYNENKDKAAVTEKRGRALALCEAVKQAIANRNTFASDCKYIHTGIGAEGGGYRNLLYLTEDGKVSDVNLEALEYVE